MKELANSVAFVTGGASGIGLSMIRAFTGAGINCVIADIEQAALDKALSEFESAPAAVMGVCLDVNDRTAMQVAADQTISRFGKVNILCNNAGVAVGGSIENMSYKDWDWVMNVNLQGTINGIHTFLPLILEHDEGGHVTNTASVAGQLVVPGMSVYTTTKFAIVGLSEVMRLDLADKGVGVSVLCPGIVNTNADTAGRNRPKELSQDKRTELNIMVDENLPDSECQAHMTNAISSGLDPNVVGQMALQAIIDNDEYIFSHPDQRIAVEQRMDKILKGFDRWQDYVDSTSR